MMDDVQKDGPHMFLDKELKDIDGLKIEDNFVEVTCGCTNRRIGDTVGKLQIFKSGDLQIKCDCTPGCKEGNLSPTAFENHSERENRGRWKNNIWVIIKDKKVPLVKTRLLKYYNLSSKSYDNSRKHRKRKSYHRDEFMCCVLCKKERRFRIEVEEECRAYHDAQAKKDWICSDWPFTRMTCDAKEERASRKALKRCPRTPSCKGCTTCFCLGCERCRFSDCSCQICDDFVKNANN
ncbi:hypothetical protein J5N97_019593 [Dioscorea zingiberensis]|uniref:Uncharacterized protein n=1 Tax=Dioscorea zingiberensis TaxID=325984 RepID=A0A9D5CEW2_9LILI|nr:hypothetical protein J5N97_019593 [Dioscorea zingiberensis]